MIYGKYKGVSQNVNLQLKIKKMTNKRVQTV